MAHRVQSSSSPGRAARVAGNALEVAGVALVIIGAFWISRVVGVIVLGAFLGLAGYTLLAALDGTKD